jgi:hypothetical protein
MNGPTPKNLHRILDDHFDIVALRELAHEMGTDYDNLVGENKRARFLSLIQFAEHRNRLDELLSLVVERRPFLQEKLKSTSFLNAKANNRRWAPIVKTALLFIVGLVLAILVVVNLPSEDDGSLVESTVIVANLTTNPTKTSTIQLATAEIVKTESAISVATLASSPTTTSTATVIPTVTSTPRPTTPIPTQTSSPTPTTDLVTLSRREEGSETVYLLAGPDISNVRLGTLPVNEIAEVIGRTEQNEWFQIISAREIEGWVAICEIVLSSSDLSTIPIVWSGAVTPKNCLSGSVNEEGNPLSSNGCITVNLTFEDKPSREFDDVLLTWANAPSTAVGLNLLVTGPTNEGETDYVIDPTYSDLNTPYKVELFKFEDGDFMPGASYTYVVQPVNVAGDVICSTEGTFIP